MTLLLALITLAADAPPEDWLGEKPEGELPPRYVCEFPMWECRPREELQQEMEASGRALRRCYSHALAENSALEGTLTVRFQVEQDGEVSRAVTIASEINDPTMEACVLGVVGQMRFAPGVSCAVIATFPLLFSPTPAQQRARRRRERQALTTP